MWVKNYGIVAATFCEDLIILKTNTRMHMRRWFFVIIFICYLRSIIKRPYLFDIKPRNRYPPHANWLVKYGLLWIASDKITIKGKKVWPSCTYWPCCPYNSNNNTIVYHIMAINIMSQNWIWYTGKLIYRFKHGLIAPLILQFSIAQRNQFAIYPIHIQVLHSIQPCDYQFDWTD